MAVIHDLVRLLRVLTLKRVHNYLLIHWSYRRSLITKNIIHKGKPAFISVEPTTHCNLHCPQCFTTGNKFTRPKGNLDLSTFEKIMQQASPYAFYLNLYFQGEPFLHENLSRFISLAKQRRFYVAVSTNAHFLTTENINNIIDAGLDKLIVSLDGADADTYRQYREGGDFNKVIEGIKALVAAKREKKAKHPFIELQCLLHKQNETQIKQVRSLGKTLGVNKVVIKSLQLLDFEKADEWLPTKGSRYFKGTNGIAEIKSSLPDRCFRMWNSCVITWNGDVVPCCFDKNADHAFGNINNQPLVDIWESQAYNDFRKMVFTNRKNISICRNCSEGL
jgi:radical SAM protein with 4Fe4S-binding SPASM domain